MRLEALHALPTGSLRALAASLSGGPLAAGMTRFGVQAIAGPDTPRVEAALASLAAMNMSTAQMAVVVDAICDGRDSKPDVASVFDLVLSGPDVPGLPTRDTAAVVYDLIAHAEREVLLVGYTIFNGKQLFEPLARRMESVSGLEVTFCLDVARDPGDSSTDAEIVERFAGDFRRRHWPWSRAPQVFYDPRSLEAGGRAQSRLHAKCVVTDRMRALITSANFTEAAQKRNIEVGVVVEHAPHVERLVRYFQALCSSSALLQCALPE